MLDDAVESLEDRVGAPMIEVGEDVLQCRRNCPARAFIGSSRECIIHEHNALNPASASVRLALSA